METNLTYYTPNLPASFSGIKKLKQHNNTPNIEKWLKKQRTYTLHKPARKRLKNYRKYFSSHYLYQIQADLIDMIMYAGYNKNYKYILTVVDIFSRYAWVQPLKSKNQKEVTSAFQKLNLKPRYLQVDQGKEFYNKEFKQYLNSNKIKLFSVYNERKASIFERFNRTIKEKLFK